MLHCFRDLSNRGLDNPDTHLSLHVYCAAERLIIKILCLFVSVEKIWTHTHESLLLYTFAFNVFESSQVGEVELSLF